MLVRAVFRFHVYFHVRLILHNLGIFLPYEDGFRKAENAYIKSICVDAYEIWMHRDWFYTTGYDIFGYEVKATERSPSDNVT